MEKDTKEAWIIMYTYYSTDEWYGGFPDNLYQWFVCDFTNSKLPTIFNSEKEANEYINDGALVNAKTVQVAGAMAVPSNENSGLHKHIVSQQSELLFAFFMWFRENGEKYMNESIEKMIQIYLKSK